MRLFTRILVAFLFFVLFSALSAQSTFAETTAFRSANIVTTDPLQINPTPYTNLDNCSATDGNTCDRTMATNYANLYFRDFGTYADFGMPNGSKITKVRIRVTGKTSTVVYVGLSPGTTYQFNCQFPSDLWTVYQLIGQTINTQTFVSSVVDQFQPGTVSSDCLQPYNFENKNFIWKINYSSGQNWSANIDNFEIAFDYEPGATPTPTSTPTPTPTPTPVPKTPLILIPGIGGSELKTTETVNWINDNGHGGFFSHIYPAGEKVWVNSLEAIKPGEDDYFDVLRMRNDGVNSEANIELTGDLTPESYQTTIDFFIVSGYFLGQDLFVFPYDWRKDIALTVPLLDQKINSIRQQTGSDKVDIIAHSMGGLVARSYISDSGRASNVRKLFTLGTPHLGAVKFLKALKFGDCLFLDIGPFCLSIFPAEVKDVIQNMISGYELAPSQGYFNFYDGQDKDHLYPYQINGQSLDYNQVKSFLTNTGHNASLFGPSESFHVLDSDLENTNGVEITNIVGSGLPTLGQIIEKSTKDFFGNIIQKKDGFTINGDEIVPLFSASLIDYSRSKTLLGDAKVFYTKQEHGNLVTFGPALNLVKNMLNNNNELPDGVSITPYSFNGTQVSIHSPVNIHIYDSLGNHTGPISNGDFEANIPGSSYDTLDDAKFIWLPDDGQYDIKFEATDQGSFDFKIRKYENDENTQTIFYNDIPLTENTKAETSLDTLGEPPTLLVDEDGNGNFDFDVEHFSILEGDANYDLTPPTISFDVNPKSIWPPNNKMVDVNITGTATDENPYLITILVDDEYDLIEPSITIQNQTNINQIIRLNAYRKGNDKNGRVYKIKILATDLAGNTSLSTKEVIVPHDKKK